MKAPTELTSDHDVMACPACGLTIVAKVTAAVALGPPRLSAGGKSVEVAAETTLVRFNVSHACAGPVQAVDG